MVSGAIKCSCCAAHSFIHSQISTLLAQCCSLFPQVPEPGGGAAAACPFGHGGSALTAAEKLPATPASACPFGHGGSGAAAAAAAEAQGQEPAAACPLGFGRAAQGPRMSELHCILCK